MTDPRSGLPDPLGPPYPSAPSPQVMVTERQSSPGIRIAGAALIANAALVLVEGFAQPTRAGLGHMGPATTFIPSIIDVVIGVSLLRGIDKLRNWAIVRVLLGALIFGGMQLAQGEVAVAVVQVGLSAALLGLLVGQAGKPRIVVSCSLLGLYALIGLASVGFALTGRNLISSPLLSLSGDIDPAPAGEVHGLGFDYRLKAPNSSWHLRTQAAMKKDNPLADAWLTRPDRDAHVMVIAERAGGIVDVDKLVDVVLANAEKASTRFQVLERKSMPGRRDGRIVRASGTISGLEITYYDGIFSVDDMAYQVIGFAPTRAYPSVEEEIREIVESFRPAGDTSSGQAGGNR